MNVLTAAEIEVVKLMKLANARQLSLVLRILKALVEEERGNE